MNVVIVLAAVLAFMFVASASAIIVYYSFQEQNANSTSPPTNPIATPSNSINNPASSPTYFGPTIPLYGGTVQLSNLYDVAFTYVIVNRTSSTGEGHDHFGFGIETHPSTLYPAFAVLNLTYLGNPQSEPWDLKFEGYLVNYTADTGVKEVYLGWFGTNYNPSSSYPPMAFPGSPKGPPQSESFHFNLTVGHLVQGQTPNSVSYGSGNSSLGLWSNGTPNTITVTIQRAGWVTVKGTVPTTITNPSRDVVLQQIQLIKSGDGFVFGSKPTF